MLPALLGFLKKGSAVKCAERVKRRGHGEGDALLPQEPDVGHTGDEIDNASGSPYGGTQVWKTLKKSKTRRYTCFDRASLSEGEDQESLVGKQFSGRCRSNRSSINTQNERHSSRLNHQNDLTKVLFDESREWEYDDIVIACVVLTDVIFMGMEGQWKPCQYGAMASVYLACDAITISVYAVHMGMLVHKEGTSWVRKPLNWLDCILNILGVVRLSAIAWFVPFQLREESIRMLRLCRLLRVLPALEGIPEFEILLSLREGLPKLMWITTVLIVAVYAFAILFTELVDGNLDYEVDFVELYFKDTGTAMLTFWSIATGAEWSEIVRPIVNHQCYLLPLMILFLAAVSFGIMNVFTGVITDSVSNVRMQSMRANRRRLMKQAFLLWGEHVHHEGLSYSSEGGSELFAKNGWPWPDSMSDVNGIDKIQDEGERKEHLSRRTHAIRRTCRDLSQVMYEDEALPLGLTMAEFMSILSLDELSEDDVTLEEFLEGLSRLLFSNQFQQTCLTWNLLQTLRRQNVSQGEHANQHANRLEEDILGSLEELKRSVRIMKDRLDELSPDNSARTQQ